MASDKVKTKLLIINSRQNEQIKQRADRQTDTRGASAKTSYLLESEAFSVLQRYHQLLLEYFTAAIRRQDELIEARV